MAYCAACYKLGDPDRLCWPAEGRMPVPFRRGQRVVANGKTPGTVRRVRYTRGASGSRYYNYVEIDPDGGGHLLVAKVEHTMAE